MKLLIIFLIVFTFLLLLIVMETYKRSMCEKERKHLKRARKKLEERDPDLQNILNSNNLAFVTLVTVSGYVPGAKALMNSFKFQMSRKDQYYETARKSAKFILFYMDKLPVSDVKELETIGYTCVNVTSAFKKIKFPDKTCTKATAEDGNFKDTFSKIFLWNLTDFKTIVFVDSDTVFIKDPLLLPTFHVKGCLSAVVGCLCRL